MGKRVWLAWLLAVPAVAMAGDDLARMNAVSRAWDRYTELSSQDKEESAGLLAASSLAHFGFLRDMALYASPEQVRRLPAMDRLLVYLLRASQPEEALQRMDGRAVAALCIARGWAGSKPSDDGGALPSLSQVTLLGEEEAVGEIGPPTETQFQFGPAFVHEDGQWKYRFESTVQDVSMMLDRSFQQSGLGEARVLEIALANLLDAPSAPALAVLDRALLDDPAARTRLNEAWPDYAQPYQQRLQAVRAKAEAGDAFAQFVIGSLLYSGALPDYVAKDEAAGMAWLEKASVGGHARAAWLVFMTMMQKEGYSDAVTVRALPHLQRAVAQSVDPQAFSALGSYYFDGLAGLPRDCRAAAEWHARAEEAGVKTARNELVWIWATCPVEGQRDPARALELAQFMIQRQDRLAWHELDTVAAALAANGRFEEAVQYQARALEGMSADADYTGRKRAAALKRMNARLSGYRRGRDFVVDYRAIDLARLESE